MTKLTDLPTELLLQIFRATAPEINSDKDYRAFVQSWNFHSALQSAAITAFFDSHVDRTTLYRNSRDPKTARPIGQCGMTEERYLINVKYATIKISCPPREDFLRLFMTALGARLRKMPNLTAINVNVESWWGRMIPFTPIIRMNVDAVEKELGMAWSKRVIATSTRRGAQPRKAPEGADGGDVPIGLSMR